MPTALVAILAALPLLLMRYPRLHPDRATPPITLAVSAPDDPEAAMQTFLYPSA